MTTNIRPPDRSDDSLLWLAARQRATAAIFAPDFGAFVDLGELVSEAQLLGYYGQNIDPEAAQERIERLLYVAFPECWSTAEPKAHRYFLNRAEQTVLAGLKQLDSLPPDKTPAIGTLPTFNENAQAFKIPRSADSAILFESGIFDLTSRWSTVVAASLSGDRSEASTILFLDLMFSSLILGTASFGDERILVDPTIRARGFATIQPAMEAFLMAHEYAHVLRRHSADIDRHRLSQELVADEDAFLVLASAFNNASGAYLCIQSLLCVWQLLERGRELMQETPADEAVDTHPPVVERRRALAACAASVMPPQQFAEASSQVLRVEDETLRLWLPLEAALPRARSEFPRAWLPNDAADKRKALARFLTLLQAGN